YHHLFLPFRFPHAIILFPRCLLDRIRQDTGQRICQFFPKAGNLCYNFFKFPDEEVTSMIYTVTLNPSLDYILSVPGFELGKTNRASEERLVPGGKGINVSTVLMNLGFQSTALGFTAGFTGKEIQKE